MEFESSKEEAVESMRVSDGLVAVLLLAELSARGERRCGLFDDTGGAGHNHYLSSHWKSRNPREDVVARCFVMPSPV